MSKIPFLEVGVLYADTAVATELITPAGTGLQVQSVGAGQSLTQGGGTQVDPVFSLRSLVGSASVVITPAADTLTFTSPNQSLASQGTGTPLVGNGVTQTGATLLIRSIREGPGMGFTIDGPGQTVFLNPAASALIVFNKNNAQAFTSGDLVVWASGLASELLTGGATWDGPRTHLSTNSAGKFDVNVQLTFDLSAATTGDLEVILFVNDVTRAREYFKTINTTNEGTRHVVTLPMTPINFSDATRNLSVQVNYTVFASVATASSNFNIFSCERRE